MRVDEDGGCESLGGVKWVSVFYVRGGGREAAGGGRRLGGNLCFGGRKWVGEEGRCLCVVLERMIAGGYCRIRRRVLVFWVVTLRLTGGYGYSVGKTWA